MSNKSNYLLFFCLFNLLTNPLFAQKKALIIKGTVIESNSDQPVEFATIMVSDKETKEVLTGTTTDVNGVFNLPVNKKDIQVEVSFIGFVTQTIETINFTKGQGDLGNIMLSEDNKTLEEVVVRAEKSSVEFKLDKRVFNVGKDLSSTGASALEVLTNVPSVNVDIEGEITLRGSAGVQILINGKPSVLAGDGNALGSITAEMIDRVEVITNPSAKYEAEGTSGIINIVIKKEERKGINGSISLNTGTPHNHSVGLSLNRRTEKFNLFSQLGVGYRELPRENENINQNKITGISIISDGTEYRNEVFYNAVLGTDYHINKYNVLTLSGNFAYEVEKQPSTFNFREVDDATGISNSEWSREETTEADNPKYRYELQYKKDFPDNKEHALLVSALGNFFGKDQSSTFKNTFTKGVSDSDEQRTRTDFKEAKYTFNIDYTKPFAEKFTLETGAQYVFQDVSNDFAVDDLIAENWVPDSSQTNIFEYDQKVLGLYATGAYEGNKWGLKLGLRLENTDLETFLVNTNESNPQNYNNLFPSVHTSYKVNERFSVQAGYSKRINRPRLWNLNPFFNIRNNFSIRTGNPDLQPEFTDSYEVTSIYIFDKSSFNVGVYHRYTTDMVERFSEFIDNVEITKPQNIGTNRATGIEINGKYTANKWLTVNGDFNYNYFKREGELESTSFDFGADRWSSELTLKFKLPAAIDLELRGEYESREKTVQRIVSDRLYANFGLRKKILKGKAIVNFSVRDVFASRIRESETVNQNNFYLYGRGLRGRFITLGFSYGFGKGEAMEFSGRRRR